MLNSAPSWLLDLPGQEEDPLLAALEDERRRRRAAEQAVPMPSPGAVDQSTVLQPLSEGPRTPVVPSTTPEPAVDPELEARAREAEAQARMLEARKADQEAAGVDPDGQPHISRQDIDGGLKRTGETSGGVRAWDPMVSAASQAFGVPTNVIQAIIDIESGGDPSATSHAGARGLMQVMPFNATDGTDLYDPATNIMVGTRMLAERYARYGSWEQAVASYFGALDANGNITSASDGNTDGYGYVDAFRAKAAAYADDQRGSAPTYGPSLPLGDATDLGNLRPSQLPEANPNLSIDAAYAACGPAAAIVFAAMAGRAPTLAEAVAMGRQIKAWSEGVGMYGMDAEVRLIQALGGHARVAPGLDPATIIGEVQHGNPVIVNSPATPTSEGHYGVISGYDPTTGRFYFGTSATDLKGGSPWMTLEEYQALRATGPITGMLLADNPLAPGPSAAYQRGGPSLPRTYDPADTHRPPSEVEREAARQELEAAQELARQVGEQVRAVQEKAKREEVERTPPPEMLRQPLLNAEFPAGGAGNLDLLRPEQGPQVREGEADGGLDFEHLGRLALEAARTGAEANPLLAPVARMLGSDDPFGVAPATPEQQEQRARNAADPVLGPLQDFSDAAAKSSVEAVKSLYDMVGTGLSATGAVDQDLLDQFKDRSEKLRGVLESHPEWEREMDLLDARTYAKPGTYATIAGQLLPSVLASMATGGSAALLLGKSGGLPALELAGRTLATRAGAAGSVFTLLSGGGGVIDDLRKLGYDDRTAFVGALMVGTLQAGIEMAGGGALATQLSPQRLATVLDDTIKSGPFLQRLGRAAASIAAKFNEEGAEEASQQVAENAVMRAFGDPRGLWDHVLESYIVGGIGGAGMGAPNAAGHLLAGEDPQARLQRAEQRTQDRAAELERGLLERGVIEAVPEAGGSPADGLPRAGGVVQQMDYGSPADGLGGSPADGLTINSSTTHSTTTESPLPPADAGGELSRLPIEEGGAPELPRPAATDTGTPTPLAPAPARLGAMADEGADGDVADRLLNAITEADTSDRVRRFRASQFRLGSLEQAFEDRRTGDAPTEGVRDDLDVSVETYDTLAERGNRLTGVELLALMTPSQREQALVGLREGSAVAVDPDPNDDPFLSPAGFWNGRIYEGAISDAAKMVADLAHRAERGEITVPAARMQVGGILHNFVTRDVQQEILARARTGDPIVQRSQVTRATPTRVAGVTISHTSRPMSIENLLLESEVGGRVWETAPPPQTLEKAFGRRYLGRPRPERDTAGTLALDSLTEYRPDPSTYRLGAQTDNTVPKRTARVGEFEAPGQELGTYARIPEGQPTWDNLAIWNEQPTAADPSVAMAGRLGTPSEIMTKVANRGYVGGVVRAAKAFFDGDPELSIPALLQAVADRVLDGKRPVRPDMTLGYIAAGTSELYGWSGHESDIAINPAEFFHFAVVNVAREEAARRRADQAPYTPEEQRRRIIELMAEKQVEILLHEAAHYWGTVGGTVEEQHGGDFARLFDPLADIMEAVNAGTLSRAQTARIANLHGLETATVTAIATQIDAMVKATIDGLTQTFATVEGQADQLALLNQDAKEQRLLALTPRTKRGTPTERQAPNDDDRPPVDADVGGGPGAAPATGPSVDGEPGAGAGGDGVRSGEGAAPVGPEPAGADELRPPEPAPAEPAAEQQPAAESAAAPVVKDPRLSFEVARAIRRYFANQDRLKQAPDARRDGDILAAGFRKMPAFSERLAEIDPGLVLGQLGLDPASTRAQGAARAMQAILPREDAAPRPATAREYIADIMARIDARLADPKEKPSPWTAAVVRAYYPILEGKQHEPVIGQILAGLRQVGYLSATGTEIRPERRLAPPAPTAETAAPATETAETAAPPPETQAAPQTPPPTRERAPRTDSEPTPRPTEDLLAGIFADIDDDAWLDGLSGGGQGTARRRGQRWANQLTVEGNREQTERNRRSVVEALEQRKLELYKRLVEAERDGDEATAAVVKRRRAMLTQLLGGFGSRYRSEYQVSTRVTETIGERRDASGEVVAEGQRVNILKYRIPTSGQAEVVVRGLGNMAADETKSREAREAARIMAEAVAKLRRSAFTDRDGNEIAMTDWVSRAIEIFYGDADVDAERYLADMTQLAETLLEQDPNIDVRLPEMMGLLLQAHQTMAREAFSRVTQAAGADVAAGTDRQAVRDERGRIVGYGPQRLEALTALRELMDASALLPSIKKLATASGRTLRIMQMAEERTRTQANLLLLKDLDDNVGGLTKLLRRVQAEIDGARRAGGRRENELLEHFKLLDGGAASVEQLRGTPLEQLGRVYFERNARGFAYMLDQLAKSVTTMIGLENRFFGTEVDRQRNEGLLTQHEMAEFKAKLELERQGQVQPLEDVRAFVDKILTKGIAQQARRRQDRAVDPETGLSVQAAAKRKFRAEGENWAEELLRERLDNLEAWQVDRLLEQIERGILPDLDAVMRDNPRKQALYASLKEKQAEIKAWKARHDPRSREYKKTHRFMGARTEGETRREQAEGFQQRLGEAYRREVDLDAEVAYLEQWLADARANGRDDPAQLEGYLRELAAERAEARAEIEDASAEMLVDLWSGLKEAVDRRFAEQAAADAKLKDEEVEALLTMHLGLAVQQKVDRQLLREALSNHDIGRVERALKALLDEHYHATYDERLDVEYWVGFIERTEREFGASEDPDVQAWLQLNRDRVYEMLGDLERHPVHGAGMADALAGRLVRAIHGDAGALVLGIRRALTAPGYRVEGTRHPDSNDVLALENHAALAALAGDRANPGPLARVLADRADEDAYLQLVELLDIIEQEAPHGLGAAFKRAVYASVEVEHRRSAILEMLPLVEANPSDPLPRYMVEMALLDLKQRLGDHEAEAWFRRRFGAVELSVRARYERAIERGTDRLEREAERAAEAWNTYEALANAGVETVADLTRAVEGKPTKQTASEIILERRERQQAEALARRIREITKAYWAEGDHARREMLEAEQGRLLDELEGVGRHADPATGETKGVGPTTATRLRDQIARRYFDETERQGIRQQGWDQRDEIAGLEREIRELHRYLLASDPGSPEEAHLRAELQDRLSDLEAVGALEPEERLRDMGRRAAERLAAALDLKTVRFMERAVDREARRAAVEEVRAQRAAAMAAVRDLIRDPQDPLARANFEDALAEMAQVGYTERRDVEVEDRDPENGGLVGTRTERREVRVPYGRDQAWRLRRMVDVRIGSSLEELDAMADTRPDRPDEQAIIGGIGDRLRALASAARESDDLGRVGGEIQALLDVLGKLGAAGVKAREREQERLRSVGFTRAMLRGDADSREQVTHFFAMIQPVPDASGRLVYSPASVGRALRLITAPNWATYYREYGIVAMLSAPTTWGLLGVNTIGQLLNVALQPARWGLKLGIDVTRGMFGVERSVYASEATAALGALADLSLWKEAGKSAFQIWWHGHSESQVRRAAETGDLKDLRSEHLVDQTRDGDWRTAPLHLVARLAHMSSLRILKATDEFIGTLAWAAAFEGQLERKAQQLGVSTVEVKNDIRALSDVVERTGKVRTGILFQDRDALLGRINGVVNWAGNRRRDRQGVGTQLLDVALTTYVPFTTVPYNAVKQSVQLSGLGATYYALAAGKDVLRGRGTAADAVRRISEETGKAEAELELLPEFEKLVRGRAKRESEQVSDYLAKAALGALVQGLGFYLALLGGLTGDEPDDPDERAIDQEEKLPPRSLRLGERWYSYDSTPFAVPFAIAGNIAQNWRKEWANLSKAGVDSKPLAVGSAGAKGVRAAVMHNFFLENLLELGNVAIGNTERTGANLGYALATPWVTRHTPALLAYFARQGDDFERDTRGETVGGRLENLAQSRLPGAREALPARVGILGQPVENRQPFGAGLISYSKAEQARFDQLFRVLDRYGVTALSAPKQISPPGRQDAGFDITVDEQRTWQRAFGEALRREVARAYNSPDFERIFNVPTGQSPADALENNRKKLLEEAVGRARRKAALAVIEPLGATPRERDVVVNERIAASRRERATTPDDAP